LRRVDRALVLTAGLGTRLRPLSLARAKAALPVAGVPLAVRILRWLAASGVTEAQQKSANMGKFTTRYATHSEANASRIGTV